MCQTDGGKLLEGKCSLVSNTPLWSTIVGINFIITDGWLFNVSICGLKFVVCTCECASYVHTIISMLICMHMYSVQSYFVSCRFSFSS